MSLSKILCPSTFCMIELDIMNFIIKFMSNNQNVATFTDFSGKTNKKIFQAPGGTSSISIGWPEPTNFRSNNTISEDNNRLEKKGLPSANHKLLSIEESEEKYIENI